MATPVAKKRLTKEYAGLAKSPPPFCLARPLESDILECHYIIRGPPDSPYAGGEYHGTLKFPPEYPFGPPQIKMLTPSGRFAPSSAIETINRRLTRTVDERLPQGLLEPSMVNRDDPDRTTEAEKRLLAPQSHAFNIKNPKFKAIFPEFSEPGIRDLPNMGEQQAAKKSVTTAATPIPTDEPPKRIPPDAQANRTPLIVGGAVLLAAVLLAVGLR